jgi:predicted S18 family serine protease
LPRRTDAADGALLEILGGKSEGAEPAAEEPPGLFAAIQPVAQQPPRAVQPEGFEGFEGFSPPSPPPTASGPDAPLLGAEAPLDAVNPFAPLGSQQKRTGVWVVVAIVVLLVAVIAALVIGLLMSTGCSTSMGSVSAPAVSSASVGWADGETTDPVLPLARGDGRVVRRAGAARG